MIQTILKRDGRFEAFNIDKITCAIFKAATACGGNNLDTASGLAKKVLNILEEKFMDTPPNVEEVQDIVEKVLIENGHAKTAKAYILYRHKRNSARNVDALIGGTIEMFNDYLGDKDWLVQENANTQKSVNGLNNYVREVFTKKYWLNEVFPEEIRRTALASDRFVG